MLIMPTTSKNFQESANKIANDFLTKGISIEDGVVEVAKAQEMNPEEVKRLVEKCNTAATVLFLKSSEDKKASFKLAKYEDVLARTHAMLEDDEEYDDSDDSDDYSDDDFDDSDEYSDDSDTSEEENTKTASQIFPNTRNIDNLKKIAACCGGNCPTPAPAAAPVVTPRNIFDAKNKINQLKQVKVATEMNLQHWMNKLIHTYQTKTAEEFNKFASDATSLHGKELLPILKYASEYLNFPLKLKKVAYVDTDNYNGMLDSFEKLAHDVSLVKKISSVLPKLEKFASIDKFSTF